VVQFWAPVVMIVDLWAPVTTWIDFHLLGEDLVRYC